MVSAPAALLAFARSVLDGWDPLMVDTTAHVVYKFSSFTLDPEWALLTDDGQQVTLRPKSFALLLLLIKNVGRLLSNETIMDALWPKTFVTCNSISQCIHEIRTALGPSACHALRTSPRRGYIFVANVCVMPSHSYWKVAADSASDTQERVVDLAPGRAGDVGEQRAKLAGEPLRGDPREIRMRPMEP